MRTDRSPLAEPSFTWTCPDCGRQVPRKLELCRCGAAQPFDGLEDAEPPRPADRHVSWLAMALAGLVVVAVAWIIATRRPTSDAAEPPPPPTAKAAAPSAALPGVPALSWPSDVPYVKSLEPAAAPPSGAAAVPQANRAIEDIVTASMPAVVLIESPAGRGTGFFVASDRVVTNAHVVQQSGYVTVVTAAGAHLNGRVATLSQAHDLAVVVVAEPAAGQPVLPLGGIADVRVGEEVLAIGSPLGFQNTVTRGIVSAVRRAGDVALVQTDAAINPGNSGGPLLDRAGRVIAVTTMKIAGSAESLGFGVAADHVRPLLDGRAPVVEAAAVGRLAAPPLPASGGDGADGRQAGEADFAGAAAEIARRADALDGEWTRFVSSCLPQTPRQIGDRGWFSIWDRGFDDRSVAPGCSSFFRDFRHAAGVLRMRLSQADEAARRAGVYPGTRRSIRSHYRLSWDGDDR